MYASKTKGNCWHDWPANGKGKTFTITINTELAVPPKLSLRKKNDEVSHVKEIVCFKLDNRFSHP